MVLFHLDIHGNLEPVVLPLPKMSKLKNRMCFPYLYSDYLTIEPIGSPRTVALSVFEENLLWISSYLVGHFTQELKWPSLSGGNLTADFSFMAMSSLPFTLLLCTAAILIET